jgi:hypothetical protein
MCWAAGKRGQCVGARARGAKIPRDRSSDLVAEEDRAVLDTERVVRKIWKGFGQGVPATASPSCKGEGLQIAQDSSEEGIIGSEIKRILRKWIPEVVPETNQW